ncbi:MAG: TIGR04211 family SH3 domain-containing protein [Syntrophobacteraceae bacterium]
MERFRPFFASAVLIAVLISAAPAFGVKAYTTDTQEVVLRNTPDGNGKAMAVIPPASAVELVNPTVWSRVRYAKPGSETREGWVPSRFLGPRPPESALSRELGAENTALKDQLNVVETEKTGLIQKEKELTDKLTKLNTAYEELKGGSANYLKLKSEYDSARTSLTSAQENIQTLIQENENLKLSQRIQWFIAGALVLLFGWFLGWATGRREKRRKSSYFY